MKLVTRAFNLLSNNQQAKVHGGAGPAISLLVLFIFLVLLLGLPGSVQGQGGSSSGDFNADGRCTEADALVALRMAVGGQDQDVALMDVTGDGKVSEADALQILRWAVAGGQCIGQAVSPPPDIDSGTVTAAPDGTAQIELYDGSPTTLHFIDNSGNPVEDVVASYVTDATGLTVFAAPQDGQNFPTIRFFPTLAVSGSFPILAATYQPVISDIPINLEPVPFEESLFVETIVLNKEHLENLPQNMPEWEERHLTAEQICASVGHGIGLGVAVIHATVHPPTGVPHFLLQIGGHIVVYGAVEAACDTVLGDDPAEEYIATFNQDLGFGILRYGMQSSTQDGFLLGQVIDSQTWRGIPGAAVAVEGDITRGSTSFTNGWYQIRLREGSHEVNAVAEGYDSGKIDAEVEAFAATLADPISLTPDDVTNTLGQGDVKVSLRWNNTADLDLHVTDPSGEEIYYQHDLSVSGGELDHDDNYPCSAAISNPVENIFWPSGEAPEGEYVVDVYYFGECYDEGATSFSVTTEVDGHVQSFDGLLAEGESIPVTTFERSDTGDGLVIDGFASRLVPSFEAPYTVSYGSEFFAQIDLENKGLSPAYCVSVSLTADNGFKVLTSESQLVQEVLGGETKAVSFSVSSPGIGVDRGQLQAHVEWQDVSDCNGTPYRVDMPFDVPLSSGVMQTAPWNLTALVFPKLAIDPSIPVQILLFDSRGQEIGQVWVNDNDIPYVATFTVPREEGWYTVRALLAYQLPIPGGASPARLPVAGESRVHVTENGQSIDIYP